MSHSTSICVSFSPRSARSTVLPLASTTRILQRTTCGNDAESALPMLHNRPRRAPSVVACSRHNCTHTNASESANVKANTGTRCVLPACDVVSITFGAAGAQTTHPDTSATSFQVHGFEASHCRVAYWPPSSVYSNLTLPRDSKRP